MNIDANTMVLISGGVSLLTILVLLVVVTKLVTLSKSVQRIVEQIPGTGMTAKELAGELGGSIESSFQKFMPQPEKVSGAITSAVETAMKNAVSGLDGIQKKLGESQNAVLDKWVAHEKNTSSGLEGVRKAIETVTSQFGTGLSGGGDKLQASLAEGSKRLAESMTDGSKKMSDAMSDGSKKLTEAMTGGSSKLEAALKDHAEKVSKANQLLSTQLDKIATLEKEIDKLLHLQQTTEGTIKAVAAADEFKQMVGSLRTHLEASDKLIKEVAKPRTIRLVESES